MKGLQLTWDCKSNILVATEPSNWRFWFKEPSIGAPSSVDPARPCCASTADSRDGAPAKNNKQKIIITDANLINYKFN